MVSGYKSHGRVSAIKRRSAMSKRKPHDIKFKFKVIECAKRTTKEAANKTVLYLNGNRVLVVLCSHLNFFSNIGCSNRLADPIITLHACSDNMSDQCYIWSDMVRCDCNKVKTFMHQKAHSQKWEHTLHYFHTRNCFDSFSQSPISMDETAH